jgi:phage-related protein
MPIRCDSQIDLGTLRVQVSATGQTSQRILATQFGDGYRERRPDGINTEVRRWSLSTPPMSIEDILELEDELRALGTGTFEWPPPGESFTWFWELDPVEWTRSYQTDHLASLSFNIRSQRIGNPVGLPPLPPPEFRLSLISDADPEGTPPGAGGVIEFQVERLAGGALGAADVTYSVGSGLSSAASSDDLIDGFGTFVLSISEGDSLTPLLIQVSPDADFESDETISVALVSSTLGTVDTTPVEATIPNDDDAPPEFRLVLVANLATEGTSPGGGGAVDFRIERTSGGLGPATVTYSVGAGSPNPASAGDLAAGFGNFNVSVLDGETETPFQILAAPDAVFEADERISVALVSSTYGSVDSTPVTAVIRNDDDPAIDPGAITYLQSSITLGAAAATNAGMTNAIVAETTQTVTNDAGLEFLTMDLGDVFPVGSVHVGCSTASMVLASGTFPKWYSQNLLLQRSNDGTTWTTFANTGVYDTEGVKIFYVSFSARYIRVLPPKTPGMRVAITEFYALAPSGPAPTGDYLYPKVSLLLPCNGADGDLVVPDVSPSPLATFLEGSAQIDTAQSKYGGSSLWIPGGGGNRLRIASSPALRVDAEQPFCLELYFRSAVSPSTYASEFAHLCGLGNGITPGSYALTLYQSKICFVFYDGSNVILFQGTATILANQWYHAAIARFPWAPLVDRYVLFLDGASDGVPIERSTIPLNVTNSFNIGDRQASDPNGQFPFNGHIGPVRFTKNDARYLAPFPALTGPFPTST